MNGRLKRRNRIMAIASIGVVASMVGLAYAAVPLYRLFCQVTGYGGTTQTAEAAPSEIGERIIKVRFNADVGAALPWRFRPVQREMTLRVGETGLALYRANNQGQNAISGQATFNVTPLKAGIYFNKIECFCFTEQRLEPGQTVDMPVSFFIDPEISKDPNLDDVKTITLSYTFFQLDPTDDDSSRPGDRVANRKVGLN